MSKDYKSSRGVLADDKVVSPKHYNNHPSGIECVEVTRHMNNNLGQATGYIWRCDDKGTPEEDLKKAIWWIADEIDRRNNNDNKNLNSVGNRVKAALRG